ncbi:glycosyltransferase family 4 protein [Neobacillus rhizophilus]|uniref:Glycosyltransferase family 4 protein n=1 Tax=Neobacillus rhizophilus TaxID=2833579 RepID=A0A942U181_9BACI|nr:glycosyltransferase family 4 protein [Neobacillus rhizophilus]MBS4212680.1 glycosyltransferase family 4 protein [Neobacillus rhizophilus]
MKKVWIINQYNMPPEYGHLNRHYNFGKYLKRMGHTPFVFVGSFLHNTNRQMIDDKSIFKKYDNCDFPYYFIKTCDYSKSNLKRIYAMYEFYRNLFKTTKNMEKPDVIIGSSAHPLAAIAAIRLAKKYNCESIVEVRDLWPESFVAYNIIKRHNPILKLLYAGEKWIYKNADKIVFTMEGGKDYIIEQGWEKDQGGPIDISKVSHINNGVDLEVFEENKGKYAFDDDDLDNELTFKVIYTGSIRLVNNVKSIVDAAKVIKEKQLSDIKFLIFGEGSDREYLEKYCQDNGIQNVIFKGYVDKKKIPYILSKSNLNIMHFKQSKIKKYGASLNKLFEYFASGKPTVSDCEFGYDLIKKYKSGIVVDNASAEQLSEAIIQFYNMDKEEYNLFCQNAKKLSKVYDFKFLTKNLEKLFYS